MELENEPGGEDILRWRAFVRRKSIHFLGIPLSTFTGA